MPGKILELSFLLAAVIAVTLSVSVMRAIFPGPGKAHDGGADSPAPAAYDIMRKVWFGPARPGLSHWPDGTLDYRIDISMMRQGWESEIRTAAREMADGTFIDAVTYSAESQNIIGITNQALDRTYAPGRFGLCAA